MIKQSRFGKLNNCSLTFCVYINYFEYDLAGNRTHLHYVDSGTDDWTYYTYNIENHLTIEETGGTATYYEYDAAGALLRKKSGGTVSYYEYNYDGLMDRFDDGNTVATYTFDTDSKRIEKDVDGTVSKYEYSGVDVVAEYDDNDALAATFNTPELDQNLTIKISNAVYHYLQDGLGSVRNLVDANEVIKNIYDYVAFGAMHGSPTETIVNPFRFTSRRWDSESSLHFYRARMYDQLLGRFTSKDPIFKENLYVYVNNNPIISIDPQGANVICLSFRGPCKINGGGVQTPWDKQIPSDGITSPQRGCRFHYEEYLQFCDQNYGINTPRGRTCKDMAEDEYNQCMQRAKNPKVNLHLGDCYKDPFCASLYTNELNSILQRALNRLFWYEREDLFWPFSKVPLSDRDLNKLRDCIISKLTSAFYPYNIFCYNNIWDCVLGQGFDPNAAKINCWWVPFRNDANICMTIIHEMVHSCGYFHSVGLTGTDWIYDFPLKICTDLTT